MAAFDGLGLAGFNELPVERADAALLACCSSPVWARRVAAGRPYRSVDEVLAAADAALAAMTGRDLDDALAGHPRIGERAGVEHAAAEWSRREQSGVAGAADRTLTRFAEANSAYEERFGHIYLVCATGRNADELLTILYQRLGNDASTERGVVLAELGKINRIRLGRLLGIDERSVWP